MNPLDQFTHFTALDGPVLSPGENYLAYTTVKFDESTDRANQRIHLIDLRTGVHRQVTEGTLAHSPDFSPNASMLAYVANHGQGTRIHVLPISGGEPRVLDTKRSPSAPRFSPDGRYLAYAVNVSADSARQPFEPTVINHIYFQRDGGGLIGDSRRHIFVYDLATDTNRQVTDGDWDNLNHQWTPDNRLVFVSNRNQDRWDQFRRSSLYITNIKGTPVRKLTPDNGLVDRVVVTKDGHAIYTGQQQGGLSGTHRHLIRVSLTGSPNLTVLLASEDLTPSHVSLRGSGLSVSADGRYVYFLAPDRGEIPVWRLDTRNGKLEKTVKGRFQVTGMALGADTLYYARQWSSELPELRSQSLTGRKRTKTLTKVNRHATGQFDMSPTESVNYKGSDGQTLQMFVLKPPVYNPRKRYPLWVNIHGGPHAMHPVIDNPLMYQIIAALGYVVMLPNPRGSISYGQTFMQACQQDWGGGDFEDIMAGVDLLVNRNIADPDRLYVEGYSYGGIMAAWIVGHTNRFRAAVIGAPVVDQVSNFGTDDEPHFSIESLGGTPQEVPDEYRKRSALTYVDQVQTPVQLQHYEGDLRCPIQQSMQFYMALKFRGIETEFVRYPGGSHVGRTPLQWRDMLVRMHDWFERHSDRSN